VSPLLALFADKRLRTRDENTGTSYLSFYLGRSVGRPCHDGNVEAVAIVSVVSTAVVGLAATWGRGRELRWQTREERTTELRGVLDEACEKLTATFVLLDQAHREWSVAGKVDPVTQRLLVEAEKNLVLEWNRVGVRRGADTPEFLALGRCRVECGRVGMVLDEMSAGVGPPDRQHYSDRWKAARTAETEFFNVASDALASGGRTPFWRRELRRGREPDGG
jgi:hypothetical protein